MMITRQVRCKKCGEMFPLTYPEKLSDIGRDVISYEADLESNRRAFQDIQDELICISNILRWKRMNRELLSDHVKRIKTIISNQI